MAKFQLQLGLIIIGSLVIIACWHTSANENNVILYTSVKSTISYLHNQSWPDKHGSELVESVNRSRFALWIASLGALFVVPTILAMWSGMRNTINMNRKVSHSSNSQSESLIINKDMQS